MKYTHRLKGGLYTKETTARFFGGGTPHIVFRDLITGVAYYYPERLFADQFTSEKQAESEFEHALEGEDKARAVTLLKRFEVDL